MNRSADTIVAERIEAAIPHGVGLGIFAAEQEAALYRAVKVLRSEALQNIRRTAERGLSVGQDKQDSTLVDICQHILDEWRRVY